MFLAPLAGIALSFQTTRHLAFPAEYRIVYEYDALLLGGAKGHAELLRRSASRNVQERSLAAQTLLDSGERRYLPRLLEFWNDPELSYYSELAIMRYREAAWPLVVERAEQGEVRAVERLMWYEESRWRPVLERLATGRYAKVRAEALRRLPDEWSTRALDDPDADVVKTVVERFHAAGIDHPERFQRYFDDPRPLVRAAAAGAKSLNVTIWLDALVKLAADPDERVREAALTKLGRVSAFDMRSRSLASVTAAVERGLESPSEHVREGALWALRGWTDDWTHLDERWQPKDRSEAVRILRKKRARDMLYAATVVADHSDGEYHAGYLSTPPVALSLAYSGDPRLFSAMKATFLRHPGFLGVPQYIDALAYAPLAKTRPFLLAQLARWVHVNVVPALPSEYEYPGVSTTIVAFLVRVDPKGDPRPILKWIADRTIDDNRRLDLMRTIVQVPHPAVMDSLTRVALDSRESSFLRASTAEIMSRSEDPRRREALGRIAAKTDDPETRRVATAYYRQLR